MKPAKPAARPAPVSAPESAGLRPALTLAQLQAAFQGAVLTRDTAVLAQLVDSPHETRERLLSVYQNGYRLRLLEVLGHDYPYLKQHMSEAAFAELANQYVTAHVSTNADISLYGARLPAFVCTTEPWSGEPVLADLARLEQALAQSFVAADGGQLSLADLSALPPEAWPALAFAPHDSAQRLTLASNARALWQAMLNGEPPPPPAALVEPEAVLVFRPELTVQVRPLTGEEAVLWEGMLKGLPFGALCEWVALYGGEDGAAARAAGLLAAWINAGLLVRIADKPAPPSGA